MTANAPLGRRQPSLPNPVPPTESEPGWTRRTCSSPAIIKRYESKKKGRTMSPRLRAAGPEDAEGIALLHADSWRRHYRGAYSDSYLDGDILTDRLSVWSSRLVAPTHSMTAVAEDHAGLAGFVHVVFDDDDLWGSLVDNLHVAHDRQRTGVGMTLLARAVEAVAQEATGKSLYLWVQEQNVSAQRFYRAMGGNCSERAPISPPGGVPSRLNGKPDKLRFTWPDTSALARTTDR
ncbi:GNAT family N-acetyltransferase [Streptomyces sp. H39-S7]|uniref:GNAT family N-acetyltransferase n=1 Tax=Streptomyces sp. H39-S7 TaxID=3004357 RepID=UPI0022AF7F6B|nr:GNAT family N-acetyltransferase [Streptomyces sp. H39-S7]MCZ4124942.1 GNAT family N-acetyltransferase [Streptomyces sp. H39-S7]